MRSSKLSTLLYIYVFSICGWFLLWLTVRDGPWWLTVLNSYVPYLFLPVPLFLVLLTLTGSYKLNSLLILPVSIFSFLYHAYLFPRFSDPDPSRAELSVMTYNVLYNNHEYDAMATIILTHQPNLVALQEVLPETMLALQTRLADDYPYAIHGTNGKYGVTAVFSRHPITDTYVLNLGEDRRAVIVKAEVNDEMITFASVHLRAYGLQWVKPITDIPREIVKRTDAQNDQVELLWETLQNESGPVIISCDCNTKETSSSYRLLDQWFDSAAHQVGWQIPGIQRTGARQDTKLQHIDYIWYRGSLQPLATYEIVDMGGSDHHPVLAVFDIR